MRPALVLASLFLLAAPAAANGILLLDVDRVVRALQDDAPDAGVHDTETGGAPFVTVGFAKVTMAGWPGGDDTSMSAGQLRDGGS